MAGIFIGCTTSPPQESFNISETSVLQERFLRHLDSEQCNVFLAPLGLEKIRYIPVVTGYNLLWMSGTPGQLNKADLVLDVVDSPEDYCIETLGPASGLRTLPSHEQIETALGDISVGTFSEPPVTGAGTRAIIDAQGDSIVAFLPVRYRDRLHELLAGNNRAANFQKVVQTHRKPDEPLPEKLSETVSAPSKPETPRQGAVSDDAVIVGMNSNKRRLEKFILPRSPAAQPTAGLALAKTPVSANSDTKEKIAENSSQKTENESEPPKTVKISFTLAPNGPESAQTKTITDKAVPANGEDLIDMTLPETMTLIQLLDLAGKYMGLNYVYDPREINNQSIALKLHGNLQGEMKVKNLYALLETVLGFMCLAMIRQEEALVAVVPTEKALQSQPELVDTASNAVQVGDTVVTRAFDIRHVSVLSVITLLQDMKLSVAATALDSANVLLVTCHAGRMNRIERLVQMIDRPGRPTECRFRRLYYTTAAPLIVKIRTLAQELEGIAVATTSPPAKPSARPVTAPAPKPATSVGKRPVYLDTDERTNRILMIGFEEELTLIEKLIDTLDVAQADPRSPSIYNIKNIDAKQALEKLEKLQVLRTSGASTSVAKAGSGNNVLSDEPLVTLLEATNQLLVRATSDQHARISEFLDYIDIAPESIRTLAYYEIENINATAARKVLEELDLISVGVRTVTSTYAAGPNEPVIRQRSRTPDERIPDILTDKPQVVVSESTNSLLVKATVEQHERLANIIKYIDRKAPAEELSYQIYPLENSSPKHISDMLERLIGETIDDDKDGKIEKVATPREQITIVPDANTFSLVVYASQRNHEWIDNLINKLDMRRPQVLIDVTLVEVTRTDTFEYDLNLVANANDAVVGNIVIDSIQKVDSGSRFEAGFNLLDQDGNPTGQTKAFYSDEKVQALLTAIQRKNYGRVLAKPKILVDDGQEGQIVTTDETTYVKESIQIPQTGTPITTRDFVPIQASIELQITPHISEGDLLRLAVHLSRDDFGTRPLSGAPPDKATSEVTTTVFVPDNRTVILGGLVKLNQSKGGSKIPILGDIPVVGGLFRSIDNSDVEKKLYVFVKANIVRPYDESRLVDLQKISDEHREAFEKSESAFQKTEDIPGIPPALMRPERILKDYK
jgi:type II secretory pathway component GspD/PulD (secretin)